MMCGFHIKSVDEMKYFISEQVLEKTVNCTKGYSCLSEERNDLCQVVSCFDRDFHFIICNNTDHCSYQKKVRERVYCNCPVRKYIYDEYNE